MSDHTKLLVPEGIKEFIFKYRFRDFLKENQKPYSGNVFERLEIAISESNDMETKFENFIVDEVSNGKNIQIFGCDFSVESLKVLGDVSKVKSKLKESGYPSENINNLLKVEDPNPGELVFLNINDDGDQHRYKFPYLLCINTNFKLKLRKDLLLTRYMIMGSPNRGGGAIP